MFSLSYSGTFLVTFLVAIAYNNYTTSTTTISIVPGSIHVRHYPRNQSPIELGAPKTWGQHSTLTLNKVMERAVL